jgi:hypothetical protein
MITVINTSNNRPTEEICQGRGSACEPERKTLDRLTTMRIKRLGLHPFQFDDHVADGIETGLPEGR